MQRYILKTRGSSFFCFILHDLEDQFSVWAPSFPVHTFVMQQHLGCTSSWCARADGHEFAFLLGGSFHRPCTDLASVGIFWGYKALKWFIGCLIVSLAGFGRVSALRLSRFVNCLEVHTSSPNSQERPWPGTLVHPTYTVPTA
jgi:hypothetical protein